MLQTLLLVWNEKMFLLSKEAWSSFLLFCVQGTLPLKELNICNLQQNCNHSQPQEFAFQINGTFG